MRAHVKAFQVRKRDASSRGQGDRSMPSPKIGRRASDVRFSGTSKGVSPRGAPGGRRRQVGISQGDRVSVSCITCGYCGKPNHSEDECWRKAQKCLRSRSTEHQIGSCP